MTQNTQPLESKKGCAAWLNPRHTQAQSQGQCMFYTLAVVAQSSSSSFPTDPRGVPANLAGMGSGHALLPCCKIRWMLLVLCILLPPTQGQVQLYTWGSNYYGQLGDGTQAERRTPQLVQLNATPSAVDLIYFRSAAVAGGALFTWGRADGALGLGDLGDTESVVTPRRVELNGTVSAIANSFYHAAAIANDRLYLWGDNWGGQLGDSTTVGQHMPWLHPLLAVDNVTLTMYGSAALAEGELYMWGQVFLPPLRSTSRDPLPLSPSL